MLKPISKLFFFLCLTTYIWPLWAGIDKESQFVRKAELYLNDLKSWSAKFTQRQPDGTVVHGELWVQRPGLLRLDYASPLTSKLYIHDGWVIQRDDKLDETTHIPLNRTPASFFLHEKISLERGVKIKGIKVDKSHSYLKVTSESDESSGSIVLVFSNRPLELKAWYIVDEAKNVTEIALDTIRKGINKPKSWFVFHAKTPTLNHNR